MDRPRSKAFAGPPPMDMCAPSSGIDSSILQSFRSLFRASFGGLILFVDILLTVPLTNAPLVEAVIDLRVRMPAEFNVEVFAGLQERFGPGYKGPQPLTQMQLTFQAELGVPPKSRIVHQGLTGFRYDSSDGKRIAQFQKDGFTFSHLAPYTNWEQFFSEAARLYHIFFEVGHPEEVTRVGVRYINRLLLPEAEVVDLTPFLTAPPPYLKGTGAVLTGFLTQIQILDPGTGVAARITQAIQPPGATPGQIPIILDIDVFEETSRSTDPDAALQRFGTLRQLKNKYFFESITEKVVEMYTSEHGSKLPIFR
jgi:uncharacterized protein (TIGR04255 family)